MRTLTVVMYHYVRDTERTRFPDIKALSVGEFQGQLDYLQQHYVFVGIEDVIAALEGNTDRLPPNSVLLTFDDGLRDHYDIVFPILGERGIRGVFFPPAMPMVERRILDVNKIQFVLSREKNPRNLIEAINKAVTENRDRFSLDAPEEYWARYAENFRFDSAEVIFVKRMIQRALPRELRSELIGALFERHVTEDEQAFAEELYLSVEQLREMASEGMSIGSHGYSHCWMDSLSRKEQRDEISLSLDFLKTVGVSDQDWAMCYPYGAFNDDLVRVVEEMGCRLGFTTEPEVSRLDEHHHLCLPRLDTNDLPKAA
jgi:peptidoglycan/xylan/chitin deacetylase (PgdA/CDA1 family)